MYRKPNREIGVINLTKTIIIVEIGVMITSYPQDGIGSEDAAKPSPASPDQRTRGRRGGPWWTAMDHWGHWEMEKPYGKKLVGGDWNMFFPIYIYWEFHDPN